MGKGALERRRFHSFKANRSYIKVVPCRREWDSGLYDREHHVLRPPGNLVLSRATVWSAEQPWYRNLHCSEGLCRC